MRQQRETDDHQHHSPNTGGLPQRRLRFCSAGVAPRQHLVTPPGQSAFADEKKRQRQHEHEDDQRVAHRVGVDFVDRVENLHGHDAGKAKDQRRAQISEGPDEHDDRAGKVTRQNQR